MLIYYFAVSVLLSNNTWLFVMTVDQLVFIQEFQDITLTIFIVHHVYLLFAVLVLIFNIIPVLSLQLNKLCSHGSSKISR